MNKVKNLIIGTCISLFIVFCLVKLFKSENFNTGTIGFTDNASEVFDTSNPDVFNLSEKDVFDGIKDSTIVAVKETHAIELVKSNEIITHDASIVEEPMVMGHTINLPKFKGVSKAQEKWLTNCVPLAKAVEKKYGVPWQTVLVYAAKESGCGTSTLAKKANAYFGIKSTKGWQGKPYHIKDDNWLWKGKVYHQEAKPHTDAKVVLCKFRTYKSRWESFMDFGKFITNEKGRYRNFPKNNEVDASIYIAKKGYATSKSSIKTVTAWHKRIHNGN